LTGTARYYTLLDTRVHARIGVLVKIDTHVHVTPPDIIAAPQKVAAVEDYFALLDASPVNKYANAEDIIAELDRVGFDAAVVFGFAFKDIGRCRAVNDYVIAKAGASNGRLIGFAVVPPNAGAAAVREVERCHDAGLAGVGELFPTGQSWDITDEAATRSLTGVCAERSLPLLVHSNEAVGHNYAGKTVTSLQSLEALVRHSPPTLDIILAHWGGGILFYELMKELRRRFARVYYDCAASPFLYDKHIYKAAIDIVGEERVLFASDYPLIPLSRYLKEVAGAGLSEQAERAFLGGNAERLLRLNR
jgi:predicted TIM-barrel fold metal-dependent hydrolase